MAEDLIVEPDRLDVLIAALRECEQWPVDDKKDRAFAQKCFDEHPRVDVLAEAKAWVIWMMDHEQKKAVKPRARFWTWLRRSSAPRGAGRAGSGARATGAGGRRTSTAPRSVRDFGTESSSRLTGW